jgi:hypothetical protein
MQRSLLGACELRDRRVFAGQLLSLSVGLGLLGAGEVQDETENLSTENGAPEE